ncbi:MAG TPA: hypothetical protein PKE06_12700 [Flavilitoribacter sp.]|nr:hypothetical protein [Flavilitoribacter sp.]
METPETVSTAEWPLWRKIAFRFLFIYFMIQLEPWTWFDYVPGVSYLTDYYYQLTDWTVNAGNRYLFHIKDVLVPVAGSGDTSYGWAQLWTYLFVAAVGCAAWSLFDRKRPAYRIADYWLRTTVRYFIAMMALSYGVIKIFALQMPFPNLSQLATPLGDFLPMRLSWMFMGYSTRYQVFAGIMETVAGLLLLNRKTVTLGLCLGAGVFANVAMMNLSYDIPVKIFSLQLLAYCLFLLAYESPRIVNFFLLNRPAEPTNLYALPYSGKWMRIIRYALKAVFLFIAVGMLLYNTWNRYKMVRAQADLPPVKSGVYDVVTFAVNGDTLPERTSDSLRWRDIVFDKGGLGSAGTTDTLFAQRYRRGYFTYQPDSATQTLTFVKSRFDTATLARFRYEMPSPDRMRLWTVLRGDSLYVELARSKRHFQLAERQFHWLSEANR